MEIPKTVKSTTIKVNIVRNTLTDSSSESGDRNCKVKICCSYAVQLWVPQVLYTY